MPPCKPPPRVLLGAGGPVAVVGLREPIVEQGAAVVGEQHLAETIVAEAARLQPDAVVLPLDVDSGRWLAARVADAAPGARLILWPSTEDVVEVQEHGSRVRRRIATEAADALRRALCGEQTSASEGEQCPIT